MDPLAKRLAYLSQLMKNEKLISKRQRYPMLPPDQKIDIRTVKEVNEGFEALRVLLREKLKTITSQVSAEQISRDLTNDQVYLSLDNWPRISKFFKENYALGVPINIYFYYLREIIEEGRKQVKPSEYKPTPIV